MVEADFAFEASGGAVDASPHWQLATGSSGLLFHGPPGSVAIGGGTGNFWVTNKTAPNRANQRAEISFLYDTATYSQLVLNDGPAGYWRLGEASGTTILDSSGNRLNGSYVGTVTLAQAGAISGDANTAVAFDGITGSGSLGKPVALNQILGVSLECWFKMTTGGRNQVVFTTGNTSSHGCSLLLTTDNKLHGNVNGSANLVSLAALSVGTWYHAIFTVDLAGTAKLYINGVLNRTAAGATPVSPISDAKAIGADPNIPDQFFAGLIDEVAFYPYALTATQTANHYAIGTGGTLPTVDRTGVLLRWVDPDNYVMLRVNHWNGSGARDAELIENRGGVASVLLTLHFVGPETGRGAIRLELMGRRARVWYESAASTVLDRPPDGGCNLGQDYSTTASYAWGMYFETNGTTNGMAITRFLASNLPLATLPPPYFQIQSASGYNFTPVALTVSGLGSAQQIEWQVLQVDPGDFPEPYSAITDGSITTHTVFLRIGYNYDLRARAINGDPGPWTDYTRLGAIGGSGGTNWNSKPWLTNNWPELAYSKSGDTSINLAPDNFPAVNPDFVLETSDSSSSGVSMSATGVERMHSTEQRPRRGFKLGFEHRSKSQYQLLIKFFDYMQGKSKPFNWTHPLTGEVFVLRFDEDQYDATYSEQNLATPIVTLTLSVIESPVGVIPTYTIRLRADASL